MMPWHGMIFGPIVMVVVLQQPSRLEEKRPELGRLFTLREIAGWDEA